MKIPYFMGEHLEGFNGMVHAMYQKMTIRCG